MLADWNKSGGDLLFNNLAQRTFLLTNGRSTGECTYNYDLFNTLHNQRENKGRAR